MYQTVNPATGEVLAIFDPVSETAIEEILDRSHRGFLSWRDVLVDDRIKVLAEVAAIYRGRRDEIAGLIGLEMGKPFREAQGEIDIVIDIFQYYADNGAALLADEVLTVAKGGEAFIRTRPVGSILGIMPWNYPHYQVARFAAPNLLLGNSVIIKHAPSCPQNALSIEEIVGQAGLPRDTYINLFATNEQVELILADPRNQGVSLTGSDRAGAAVAEIAGRHLKKCVLELGGSDAFILLDTDDLDATVEAAAAGRMYNAGQACNSPKRFIVVEELYDRFVAGLRDRLSTFDPATQDDPRTTMGPVSSRTAAEQLQAQVDDAVAKGATLHLGGKLRPGPGAFFEPTLLTGITPGMRAYREELFGPVAVVYQVRDDAEAIALANDSPYGLSCGVYSASSEKALAVADQLDTGMAWINGISGTQADLPFGGVKRSGYGRELGTYGVLEFANKKIFRIPD